MPYAPTNLYPRNIALERSYEPIFLGNIDNEDVIDDMQVELIDPKGVIQGVIYPKNSGYYSRSEGDTSEIWTKNSWEGSYNKLPLEGYYDNNLVVKTENMSLKNETTMNLVLNKEQSYLKSYSPEVDGIDDNKGEISCIDLNIPIEFVNNNETIANTLKLSFERQGKKNTYHLFSTSSLRKTTFNWKLKEVTFAKDGAKVSSYKGNVEYYFGASPKYTGGGDYNLYAQNGSIALKSSLTVEYGEFSYWIDLRLEDSWSFHWDNDENDWVPELLEYYLKFKQYVARGGAGMQNYEVTDLSEVLSINMKSNNILGASELLENFSWRFLLTGKNYDRFIHEGSIEKADIENKHYYKIPAVVGCPNYLQDKKTGKYFKKSLTYPSFYWGDVCEVKQTYGSENNYSYTITLPNALKWLGTFNMTKDAVIMLGVYDIASEIESFDPNDEIISFTSEKAYIATGKSITQKIFVTIERIWDYLQLIDLTPETPRYFVDGSRIISDSDSYSNSIEFDTVQLYTNEIYSIDNKYEQVEPFLFTYDISTDKNVLIVESQIIDRLREYQVFIYKNDNLIHQSKNIIANKLDYHYLETEPNTAYKIKVKAKTSEGLQKILEKEIITEKDAFNEFIGKLIQKENYNTINIRDSFVLPQLIAPFYTIINRYYSIWKDNKNLVYKKLKGLKDNYFIDYDIDKNKAFIYRASFLAQAFINQNEDSYPSVKWDDYELTMLDSGLIIKNGESNYYYNYEESFSILVFYDKENNKISLDIFNNKFQINNGEWIDILKPDITFVENQSDEVVTLELSNWKTEKTKPHNWISTVLYGTKYNYDENSKNVYEVDLDQVWYFNLDTQSGNIDFTTEHNIYNTLSNHPKVGISNANYMSQSITTRLGYLNKDDIYVEDNGEKLNKFAEFANSDTVKVLRLPNGYLIPVDIQLTNNVSQLNLVGEPSTITFKWTQIADHKSCVLYGLGSTEAGIRAEQIEQKDPFWNEVS